jgi:hypothetical protein
MASITKLLPSKEDLKNTKARLVNRALLVKTLNLWLSQSFDRFYFARHHAGEQIFNAGL